MRRVYLDVAALVRRASLVLGGLSSAALGLGAAQQAQPAAQIDGRRLRQKTDTFAQYMIDESSNDTARAGDVVTTLRFDGTALTYISLAVQDPVLTQADTLVQALADLRPISHVTHSRGGAGAVRFTQARVEGWLVLANGDTMAVNTPLPGVTYDGGAFDLIVRASRLDEGAQLVLSAFVMHQNAVVTLRGRVTGTDVIDGHPCWVFRGVNGTLPVTFWIDKETRDLRRQLVRLGGFSHVLASRPPGEVATLTDDERDDLLQDSSGLRHRVFGFVVPLPSQGFERYTDMEDALRGMLGQRHDMFLWTYRVPGDSFFGFSVIIYKGFDGTQEGFRRFLKDILPSGRTGDEAMYSDSIYWEGERREYRMASRDKRGVTGNLRCIPSPESRRPGVIACVLLAGGFPGQIRTVQEGLRFTTFPP